MADVIVLDRIEPGWTPPYCTHGRATCIACPNWVWLGHKTHDVVKSGRAQPLCRQCANRLILPGTKVAENVQDHRRADGPHT